MASVLIEVQTSGVRDAHGRFARLHGSYVQALRNIAQGESARLRNMLQAAAPRREGEFAKGFHYKTGLMGHGQVEAQVYYSGKKEFLLPILEQGARAHPIEARNVSALRFYWERGPEGPGIYFYRRVSHPGIKGTAFVARTIQEWYPSAMSSFYTRAQQVTRTA